MVTQKLVTLPANDFAKLENGNLKFEDKDEDPSQVVQAKPVKKTRNIVITVVCVGLIVIGVVIGLLINQQGDKDNDDDEFQITLPPAIAEDPVPTGSPSYSTTNSPSYSTTSSPSYSTTNSPSYSTTSSPSRSPTRSPSHSPTRSPTECSFGNVQEFLPGWEKIGTSYNVISGARKSMFKTQSFDNCNICVVGTKSYQCPDFIKSAEFVEKRRKVGPSRNGWDATQKLSGYSQTVQTLFGEANAFPVSAAASDADYNWMFDQSRDAPFEFSHQEHYKSLFVSTLSEEQELLPTAFSALLDLLKKTSDDAQVKAGMDFLHEFGTHVTLKEPLGGFQNLLMKFSTKFFEELGSDLVRCLKVAIGIDTGYFSDSDYSECQQGDMKAKVDAALAKGKHSSKLTKSPGFSDETEDSLESIVVLPPEMAGGNNKELFKFAKMADIGNYLVSKQKLELDTAKLKTIMDVSYQKYLEYFQPSNCGADYCVTGTTVVNRFDSSDVLPFGNPSERCTCVCTSQYSGERCEVHVDDLTLDERLNLMKNRCSINFSQQKGQDTLREVTVNFATNYEPTIMKLAGDVDGTSKFIMKLTCDSSCNDAARCAEGHPYKVALDDLKDFCMKLGHAPNGGDTPTGNEMEPTCGGDPDPSVENINSGTTKAGLKDAWLFSAYVRNGYDSPMRTVLKYSRLVLFHGDNYAQLRFDGKTCSKNSGDVKCVKGSDDLARAWIRFPATVKESQVGFIWNLY